MPSAPHLRYLAMPPRPESGLAGPRRTCVAEADPANPGHIGPNQTCRTGTNYAILTTLDPSFSAVKTLPISRMTLSSSRSRLYLA